MDIELARAIPFLRDLTEDELKVFAALLTVRECQNDEIILEEGMKPKGFCVVSEGVVHVRRRGKSTRSMLLARIGPGGFFSEINLFDPGVSTASIIARNKVRLAVISYEQFRAFMDEHPRAGYRIASALLTEVCRRLRDSSQRLAERVLEPEKKPPAPPVPPVPPVPVSP
jgi:CRP-like cAMP-binding protein